MNVEKPKTVTDKDKNIARLISQLKHRGITFKDNDGEFNNVIFSTTEKDVRIHKSIFYRTSGISRIMKGQGDDVEFSPLTDEEFYETYFKAILAMYFPVELSQTKIIKKEVISHTINVYGDDQFATPMELLD